MRSSAFFLVFLAVALIFSPAASAKLPPIADSLEKVGKPFDAIGHNFDILSRLVRLANLTDTLATASNYTLFAPNDDAFIATARELAVIKGVYLGADAETMAFKGIVMNAIRIASLNKMRSMKFLRSVLLNHVVPGVITADALATPAAYKTMLDGGIIGTIGNGEIVDGNPKFNNPSLVLRFTDIKFANNVTVHVINRVLFPKFR